MRLGIIGCGLIGGSIGLAAKRTSRDIDISIYDAAPAAAAAGVRAGAGDRVAASVTECAADADVIFVCVPVGSVAAVAVEAAKAAPQRAIVTDVGSTKLQVVVEVEDRGPLTAAFVGGHPMAGSEQSGVTAAREDLFDGAWWILTPRPDVADDRLSALEDVVTTLGARPVRLDPVEHDRLMAVLSHLPQLLATTLADEALRTAQGNQDLFGLAAGGFRDVTRIAASDPRMWLDICATNAASISEGLDRFSDRLQALSSAVREGRYQEVLDALYQGKRARDLLPAAGKPVHSRAILVRIPDRPGVLAEVTAALATAQINVENLEIVHSAHGGTGVLRLWVDHATASRAAETVAQLGYAIEVEG